MPFQETSVESGAAYDDFCVHTKNRRVRLCTLGVLLRLGVAGVAADALAAFEVHAVADGDALVHMDLVVDGVAEVTAVRPDLRPRVLEIVRSALTARGGAAAGDPRTRFKMLDVAESCRTARPQTRPRRAG